jgi:hypothetical protein
MKKIVQIVALLITGTAVSVFSQDRPLRISLTNFDKEIKLSAVFNGIQYIPLETNQSCFLSYPEQIDLLDSHIVIQDHKESQVYLFSSLGKFITTFGQIGKGPGEFISFGDFYIDQNRKSIEILDQGTAHLHSFDLSGKLIEDKKLIWCSSFAKTNSDRYLMYSGYATHFHDEKGRLLNSPVALVDSKGKVVDQFEDEFTPFAPGVRAITFSNAITIYGDTVLFCPNRSNIVYQFIDNKLSPRIVFDFGKLALPQKYSSMDGLSFDQFTELQSRYIVDIFNYYENKQYIYLNFSYVALYQVIIRKVDRKAFITKSVNYINDIDNIQFKYFHIMGTWNEYSLYYIQSVDFRNQVTDILGKMGTKEREKYKKDHPEIIKIFNLITNDDNPIIVKLKCK